MIKKALIVVSAVAILLAVGFTYVAARFVDKAAIERAHLQMEQLRGQRDSLTRFAAGRDSMQRTMTRVSDSLIAETTSLRRQVRELEKQRAEQQLAVRMIAAPEDLRARLESTFPEVAASDWAIVEVLNTEEDVSLQYLRVPLWFSETFIIDHQNSANYAAQVDRLRLMDTLQQQTITLKDSILTLEKQKSAAYKEGYDSAYTKFSALNQDYVKLLKSPRLSLKWTGPVTVLGSAAAGLLIGVAVQ